MEGKKIELFILLGDSSSVLSCQDWYKPKQKLGTQSRSLSVTRRQVFEYHLLLLRDLISNNLNGEQN